MLKTASCNLCLLLNLQFSQGDRKCFLLGANSPSTGPTQTLHHALKFPVKSRNWCMAPIWPGRSSGMWTLRMWQRQGQVAFSMFKVNTLCSCALTAFSSPPSSLLWAVMSLLWMMVSPSVTIMNCIPDGSGILRKWSCIPGCYPSMLERQEVMAEIYKRRS